MKYYVKGHLNNAREWVTCGQPCAIEDRIFTCHMPTGISYSDRCKQEGGDYAKLAHLFYDTLELDARDCPPELLPWILEDAARYKRGAWIQTSASGQPRQLGVR